MARVTFTPRDFFVLDRSWDRKYILTWKSTQYTSKTITFEGIEDDTNRKLYTMNVMCINKVDRYGEDFTEAWVEIIGRKKHKAIVYGEYKDVLDVVRQMMWDVYKYA